MTFGLIPRVLFSILVLGTVVAHGSVQVQNQGGRTHYKIEVESLLLDPIELDGHPFIQVGMTGVKGLEGVVGDEGKPQLPAIRFYVDGDGDIKVQEGPVDRPWGSRSSAPVKPAQPSLPKQAGAKSVLHFDRAAYLSTELFPAESFTVEKVGTIKGRLRRLVSLFPVRYEAAGNRFETIRKFDVLVGKSRAVAARSRAKTLAVVVGAAFKESPSLQTYLDFKKTQGYQIVRLEFLRDAKDPVSLRSALQTILGDSTKDLQAAILVGDNADVPGYKTKLLSGVTDHYYRCLDTADYESDIATPDIALGRFAVSTETELANVIRKQIKYEAGNFTDTSWINKITLIATDDSSHFNIAEGSYDYLVSKYTGPQGFLGTFPSSEETGGDLLYAIRHKAKSSQVVDRLREGRGFINYGGHGSDDYWAGPQVTAADVHSITHSEATPFVMANACLTGKFTVDSFAETWQRHPQGSVAYWGSMDSTYWDEDDIVQRQVYDVMFRDNDTVLGNFTDAGLAEVWRHYGGGGRSKYYWETYVVFGDPTTTIRLFP